MHNFNILFHNKRVGSTFLQNAIDSHFDLAGVDECFVNMARKPGMRKSGFVPYLRSDTETPEVYIEHIIKKTHSEKKAICMKLAYNQIEYHNGLMQYIRNNNIPMIHIMRKNIVKQIISGLNAAYQNHNPVVISGKYLLHMVKEAHRLNNHWANKMKSHIKLTFYYEDIIGETIEDKTYVSPNANIAICNFFGIDQVQLYSKTKKKNKKSLETYLPNLNDIRKVFKGTKFSWMLEGE